MKMNVLLFIVVLLLFQNAPTIWGQQGFKTTPILKESTTIVGQKLEHAKTDKPEVTSILLELEPGGETGRHMHPYLTYIYVLEGTLTVDMDDGSSREFPTGKAFLEATNTWHNGKNMGKTPLKVLGVFVGEEGKPILIRPEKK